MSMSSFVFFSLLNESYKVEAEERLGEITVGIIPHLDEAHSRDVIDSYKRQASGILELFDTENVSSVEDLKKALNQKD